MPDGDNISPILQRFRALATAGYGRDLLPIMPANLIAPGHADYEATPVHLRLSEHSKIKADPGTHRVAGKIPGKLIDDGWAGFGKWTKHEATDADFGEWASWPGVGIGLNTRDYAAFDIDVLDAELAEEIAALVIAEIGPAPVRIGRAPKRLLLFKSAAPIEKRRLAFTLPDGTAHAVEVLGDGQQFVAEGMHPSGKPYTWPNGDLSGLMPDCLAIATAAQTDAILGKLETALTEHGAIVRLTKGHDGPAEPPTGEPLERERAVRMASVLDPGCSYDEWRNFVWAIMAIPLADGTPEEQHEWRRNLAHDWSAGKYWPGGCPLAYEGPETVDAIIASDKHKGVNVGTLIDAAMKAGFDPGGEPSRDDTRPIDERFAGAFPPRDEEPADNEPFVFIRDRVTQLNSPSAEMQVETIVPWKKLILPWGDTDAGKTYWSVEIVTAIAMERPAFGRFQVLKPGPVIIFAGEDSDRLEQSRLTAIEHHYGKPLQGLVYTVETAIPVDDPDLFEKYCDEMRRLEKKIGPIAAVLNDTLKRSLGSLKPNDGEVGQRFTMAMEALIREFKCTVITNAHQPKSGAEGGIAGTKSFTDNAPVTPHLIRLGEKPFDIRCEFEPKYRVGPRPAPFEVRGEPVALPKPVAGVSTDLAFAALAPDALRRAYRPDMAGRGEAAEFTAIMDERGAHDVLHGLTTDDFADAIVGPPAKWGSLDKYRQEFGKVRARLDAGSRGKKQRNGKVSPARYAEWCDRDYREGGKGVLRWFCLAPHLRAAPPEHDELGADPMHEGGTEK